MKKKDKSYYLIEQNLLYMLVLAIFCVMAPNIVYAKGANIDGRYEGAGDAFEIHGDSIVYHGMVVYAIHKAEDVLFYKGRIKAEGCNMFTFNSFIFPLRHFFEGMTIEQSKIDTIPNDSLFLEFDYPGRNVLYKLSVWVGYKRNRHVHVLERDTMDTQDGKCRFAFKLDDAPPESSKTLGFCVETYEYPPAFMPSIYLGHLYYETLYLYDYGILINDLYDDGILINDNINFIKVTIPNMDNYAFRKYDLYGDYFYCNGKELKWKGRTFKKR